MKTFKKTSLATLLSATAMLTAGSVVANEDPLKLGLMLPYSGTYTALGEAITNGLKLAIEEEGGQLGGRDGVIVKTCVWPVRRQSCLTDRSKALRPET